MFPFPVVFVGCSEEVASVMRRELRARAGRIQAEYDDWNSVPEDLAPEGAHRLLLVAYLRQSSELAAIKDFHQQHSRWPILLLVETSHDPNLLIQAIRAGASQIVPVPIKPGDVQEALDCLVEISDESRPPAPLVAVANVSGGCGGTSLACNLAAEITRTQRRVLLMEIALWEGKLATYLDVKPNSILGDVLEELPGFDEEAIKASFYEVHPGLFLLGGSWRSSSGHMPKVNLFHDLLAVCRYLVDVIIVDLDTRYTPLYFESLIMADFSFLVVEQTIPSMTCLRNLLHQLYEQGSGRPTSIVLNRYEPQMEGLTVRRFEELFPSLPIFTVAYDPEVRGAINEGCLVRQRNSNSRVLADLTKMAESFLGGPVEPQRKGLFDTIRWLFGGRKKASKKES